MKHIILILAIFLISITSLAKPYNILVMHSYQQEFPQTKRQHQGFIDGLSKASGENPVNIFIEYLNAKTSTAVFENDDIIDRYLQTKYLLNKPDIIYATNDEALHFMTATMLGYLKDVPLVFTGASELPAIQRSGIISGIIEKHDVGRMISSINAVFGGEPEIIFLDAGSTDAWVVYDLIKDYKEKTGTSQNISFEIRRDIDVLIKETKGSSETVYVLISAGGFHTGPRHETLTESITKLKNGLPSPYIFNMHELEIRQGLLGGYVSSGYRQGFKAGGIAWNILSGKRLSGELLESDNNFIFDRQALDKAGLQLPRSIASQAELINKYPSFLEKYAQLLIWVIAMLVAVILSTSVSFSLYTYLQHKRLKEASVKLKEAGRKNRQYMQAVDASNLVSTANLKGRITYINDNYLNATGYTREELIGKDHRVINDPSLSEDAYKSMIKTVMEGHIWLGILQNRTKSGETIYLESSIVPLKDSKGKTVEYLSVRKDITEFVKQQRKLQSQYTDVLTGLPNRLKMRQDRDQSINPAVAVFNIDGFSIINTFYGMEVGDYILQSFAKMLTANVPTHIKVYRLSGDEFGILDPEIPDIFSFRKHITELMEKLSAVPIRQNGSELHLSLTAGIAYGKGTVITKAGMALKHARKSKKTLMSFDEAESEMVKIRETVQYTGSLRYALENDKLFPYFQPIADPLNGRIVKYEALARIEDENGNILLPADFLYLSKQLKLYKELSMKMIEKTLEKMKDTEHGVCINFDKEDIQDTNLQDRFFHLVEEYRLQGRITIEITESEGMDNMDELVVFVSKAKHHGCLIALDDFGTGYSNFMYILSLQPDFLKIDGSITRKISTSVRARLLTETITQMCRQAGIKTVAEYVATEDMLETIKEIGIDYCQGYLYGKPEPDFIS